MRNIGLASIEAVRPQLGQNSNVPHKTSLHAKFQVISSIGGRFMTPPVRESGLCSPPFNLYFSWNLYLMEIKFEIFPFLLHVLGWIYKHVYKLYLYTNTRLSGCYAPDILGCPAGSYFEFRIFEKSLY